MSGPQAALAVRREVGKSSRAVSAGDGDKVGQETLSLLKHLLFHCEHQSARTGCGADALAAHARLQPARFHSCASGAARTRHAHTVQRGPVCGYWQLIETVWMS